MDSNESVLYGYEENWHWISKCSWEFFDSVGQLRKLGVMSTRRLLFRFANNTGLVLPRLLFTRWPSGTMPYLRLRCRQFESCPRLYCVPLPTQRAIPPGSVNEYQRKLGSKRAYHAMHWSRIRGHAASAGVRLMANDTEISAAPWALRLGKDFFTTVYATLSCNEWSP